MMITRAGRIPNELFRSHREVQRSKIQISSGNDHDPALSSAVKGRFEVKKTNINEVKIFG